MKKNKILYLMTVLLAITLTGCSSEKENTLKVAMECSYAPYNWTQPSDANGAVKISGGFDYANGYDVKMAQLIADKLGRQLEIVKLDWDSLVPAVQSGTVDCAIAGQSITSERAEMVDFSMPYYYATIVVVVKEDSSYARAGSVADLAGAMVTSQQNTIWYDICLPQIPSARLLPAQESASAMLAALEAGKCDLVVTDMPTGMAACEAYQSFKLLDFSNTEGAFQISEEATHIGISMQKGNEELRNSINNILAELTKEELDKMMEKVIAIQPLSEF